MTDISLIKETYAAMADEQLIAVAKQDGHTISYEAFIVLKRELLKRKLDPLLITDLENTRVEESKKKVLHNLEREDWIINHNLWQFVFEQKANRQTNAEIIEGLIQKGVSREPAQEAVTKIESHAREIFMKLKKAMLISFALLLSGLLLCGVALIEPALIYCLGPGLIILINPLLYFRANNKAYRFYEKVLDVVEEEKGV